MVDRKGEGEKAKGSKVSSGIAAPDNGNYHSTGYRKEFISVQNTERNSDALGTGRMEGCKTERSEEGVLYSCTFYSPQEKHIELSRFNNRKRRREMNVKKGNGLSRSSFYYEAGITPPV